MRLSSKRGEGVLRSIVAICLCWLTLAVSAHGAVTEIRGTVYDDEGAPFAKAPILLINGKTGAVHQTRSEPGD